MLRCMSLNLTGVGSFFTGGYVFKIYILHIIAFSNQSTFGLGFKYFHDTSTVFMQVPAEGET